MGWGWGRRLGVVGLGAVLVGLAVAPEATTRIFWWGLLPALPAVFLVNPSLWRNVCPVATLSAGPAGGPPTPGVSGRPVAAAGAAGVPAFVALVLWRGTGLESRPTATLLLLLGLLAVAVLTGRRAPLRSGFCNRLCPLLPLERIYGQRPLTDTPDSACATCTLCTPRGCLDLSPTAAAPQLLGPGRADPGWLRTPFGASAAALPGFVTAWFLATPATDPGRVVLLGGGTILGAALSWTMARGVVTWTGASWRSALPTLAALAAGIFYLFGIPRSAAAFGVTGPATVVLQAVALGLVGVWWVRARPRPAGSRRRATG